MIVYREWESGKYEHRKRGWAGWFLFGFIPLYVHQRWYNGKGSWI